MLATLDLVAQNLDVGRDGGVCALVPPTEARSLGPKEREHVCPFR